MLLIQFNNICHKQEELQQKYEDEKEAFEIIIEKNVLKI